jgi:nucleoid DNA-binding protein
MKNSSPKLTSHEIVDMLSAKASIKKNIAEDFLKNLFVLIEESLFQGESVKIKNLGTFKLQWNEARKSVNVQTGEEIILPGHNKVVFIPDEKLKDLVNTPFAHLEPVVVSTDGAIRQYSEEVENISEEEVIDKPVIEFDPLKVFTEQASEIMNIISEIQSLDVNSEELVEALEYEVPMEQIVDEIQPEATDEVSTVVVEEDEIVVEIIENTTVDGLVAEIEDNTSNTEQRDVEESVIVEKTIEEAVHEGKLVDVTPPSAVSGESMLSSTPEKPKKKKGLLILSFSVILILVLGASSYFLFDRVSGFVNSLFGIKQAVVKEEVVGKQVEKVVEAEPLEQDTAIQEDTAKLEKEDTKHVVDSTQLLLDGPRTYKEFIATERIKSGSRLAQMSLRYYGARDFWVYIYEANQDHIPDPDNITKGTIIKIPKLDKRLTDISSAKCMEKAHQLHKQYKKH